MIHVPPAFRRRNQHRPDSVRKPPFMEQTLLFNPLSLILYNSQIEISRFIPLNHIGHK